MTEQAYKRATEIKQRIEKLKEEIEWLDNRAGCGWRYRRIFGVKKIPVIRAAEKMSYEEYFDLETDDVIALQDRRLKLIWELQKEFDELQFYGERRERENEPSTTLAR